MATAQAERKVGRPRKSERNDSTARLDADVLAKAGLVAKRKGISIAEYLTELVRPIVDKDFAREAQRLTTKAE